MLYFDRIDVSEGTDVNKTSASKQCDFCHYLYFLNYSLKFQHNLCNRCHHLLMMSIKISDIAISNIKGSDYCCIISLISKNEAIKLMKNDPYKKILKIFEDIEIEKSKFYHHKTPYILRKYKYLKRFLLVKKYKYFIGYLYNGNKVKPSNIMPPKTSTYVKS